MERVAIIGLGLIGGSIALAIKRSNIQDLQVVGTARTRDTLRRAKKMGAIDIDAPTAADAARDARLVVIAVPIMATRPIMEEIAPVLAPGTVVTDVASTKGNVARWAKELLPDTVNFVGGHPMAGKEQAGIAAADPDLFKDRAWVVAPSVNATETAVNTVVGLAQLAGATPMFMDADEHDSYVAAISHLPLLLSSALFSVAQGSAAWPELSRLASSGFRDTTRLASGSPEMAHDIVLTNRDNVIHWLDRFIDELHRFRGIVAGGASEEVIEAFTKAQLERDNYMVNGPPERETGEPIPKISLGDMILGSAVSGYMKKQQEILKAAEERAGGKRR